MEHDQANDSPSILLSHLYRDGARLISRHLGMSLSRMDILHELMHAGEISQAQLQQRLGIEGSLITRFVKQMQADGIVTRRADPKDNRYTLVSLAPGGEELVQQMKHFRETFEANLLEGMSAEERAILVRAIQRAQDNLARWQKTLDN